MTKRIPDATMKDQILGIMQDINAQYGDSLSLMEGTSGRWPEEKIIRTGSLQLDLAIGVGGWPRGRIGMIYGPESCGKSTIALHAVREAQAQGLMVVYIDAENALDPNYMRKLGINLDLLLVSQPASLEVSIDLMNSLMDTSEVGLIVLDSIAALKAQEVIDGSAEKQVMAAEARIWSSQLPRLSRAARSSNTTILMINQPRAAMSMYTADSLPGGRALGFYSSLKLKIKKIQEGKKNDGLEGLDYQEGAFTLEKNKVASPYKKGSFFIVPGNPIDVDEDIVIAAMKKDVILKDTFFDRSTADGTNVTKKGWHALPLTKADIEAIQVDEPEFDDYLEFEEPLDDIVGVFQVYQYGKFEPRLREWPTFLDLLEERVLDTLNLGATFIDSETTLTEADVVANQDTDASYLDEQGGEASKDWGDDEQSDSEEDGDGED